MEDWALPKSSNGHSRSTDKYFDIWVFQMTVAVDGIQRTIRLMHLKTDQ